MSFEQLIGLSIDDLSILAESVSSVTVIGIEAKHYVSTQIARDSVYVEANISESDNAQVSTSVGVSDGKVIYDITVKLLDNELLFKVDVKTGKILERVTSPLKNMADIALDDSGTTIKDNTVAKSGKDSKPKTNSGASDKINNAIDSAVDDIADAVANKIYKTKDKVIESVIK